MQRANYARYVQSDRRTWAWLWLKRNSLFREQAAILEAAECTIAPSDSMILLDEDLSRHF
ncbi:hypothetical protein [Asticcacaulis taihuensis]